MKGKRLFTAADRALWMAKVNAQVSAFEEAVNREIPEFDFAAFEDSTEVTPIAESDTEALLRAGAILKAQLRRFALTVIPSNMCGCPNCTRRANILMREYNECAQAMRAIQLVLSNNGLAGIAADRDRHDEIDFPARPGHLN